MPRKPKASTSAGNGNGNPEAPHDPPKNINPYEVLGIESTATATQIRSAYLKLALKLHPDKVTSSPSATEDEKSTVHNKFQELAFAYGVLSDPARKARYDTTGSTSDRLDGAEDFFDWANFYRSQFKEVVTTAHIEEFRKKYQGSEEERGDVLGAYEDGEGDLDYLFERVMCSEEERDLERFREMVADAVKAGEVPRYEKFWKGDGGQRKKRRKGEEEEAREYARKLGVYEALFGKDGTEGSPRNGEDRKAELEGEAEVSGEDSGDEEEDGAVAEEDDGFIVDKDEDEEMDEQSAVKKEEEDEEDEAPRKATRSKRSARASGKTKVKEEEEEKKPTLKEELKANLATSKSSASSKPSRASKAAPKPKPEPAPKPSSVKTKRKTSASSRKTREEDTSDVPESQLAGLEALIRSRQKNRFADMISNIEDRYVNKTAPKARHAQEGRGKGGRKRKVEEDEDIEMVDADDGDGDAEQGPEPTEEEFEKIRARLEAGRANSKKKGESLSVAGEGKGRGKKRGRK